MVVMGDRKESDKWNGRIGVSSLSDTGCVFSSEISCGGCPWNELDKGSWLSNDGVCASVCDEFFSSAFTREIKKRETYGIFHLNWP